MNFLRMLTMTYLKRMRKKMREMMFTFLMQIGRVLRLSSQIEKLCNAVDNISQATCSLTPAMNPYGIPQVVKLLDNMSEEVLEASPLYFFSLKLLLNKDTRIIFLSSDEYG
ncbi:hypothetical protein Godav_021005 [Gossypium davidsonii]|uniref:Uncharacterized protein n=2 Tax=Gossypium TaxID=3633 RepID=A0A7J8R4T3_GOSDV|nr:hypothetical protein [Gossypium davidsonii]